MRTERATKLLKIWWDKPALCLYLAPDASPSLCLWKNDNEGASSVCHTDCSLAFVQVNTPFAKAVVA